MRGPAILLTEGVQTLRLDGLLTLIAITDRNLGGLMKDQQIFSDPRIPGIR